MLKIDDVPKETVENHVSVGRVGLVKYFIVDSYKDSVGRNIKLYCCLNCKYESKSFMGIQSHIRKHKNEFKKKVGQGQQRLI